MKYIDWLIQWLENISARPSKYGLTSDTGSLRPPRSARAELLQNFTGNFVR